MGDLFKVAVALVIIGVALIIVGLLLYIQEKNKLCKCTKCSTPEMSWRPWLVGGLGLAASVVGLVLYFVDSAKDSQKMCNNPLIREFSHENRVDLERGPNGTIIKQEVLVPIVWNDSQGKEWVLPIESLPN